MGKDENLHAGHRARAVELLLNNADALTDHQILEVLLFYVVPRIDTNPLAHRLIKIFGDINGVFTASKEQLSSVEGVGEKVSAFIVAMGEVLKRASQRAEKQIDFSTPQKTKEYLVELIGNERCEKFVALLLDKKFSLVAKVEFTDNEKHKVSAEIPELVSALNVYKPKHVILTHNHTSNSCSPTEEDDVSTKKINLICELNGVNLVDHVIVAGERTFSYKAEGIIDQIKNQTNLEKIFKHIKNN